MIYLVLDTNIWIYLANGLDPSDKAQDKLHFELLSSLKSFKDKGDITILVNDIILKEWARNKNHCEGKVKSLQNKLANPNAVFNEIKKYAKTDIDNIQREYLEGIEKEILENQKHIVEVENFLHNDCLKIEISDKVKLQIFDMSVGNKAPFQSNKNNVADASILFSSAEYLEGKLNEEASAIFVSYNFKDFTDNINRNDFHPEILDQLWEVDIKYEQRLPAALKLSKKIIAQYEEYYKQEAWLESIRFYCISPFCYRAENFQAIGYLDDKIHVKLDREDFFDPNQLSLFPDIPQIIQQPTTVKIGHCTMCETLHLECPECKALVCIEDEIFDCPECQLSLEIGYDRSLNENCLFIITKTETENVYFDGDSI